MSQVAGVAFRAPGDGFDPNDEAQFRRSVEQSIQAITQPSFKTGTPSALSSGDNNNYDIGPVSTFLRLSANASDSAITGLTDGIGERRILLLNISANTLTLEHQDGASSATNRIVTPNNFAMTLLQDDMAELIYDDVSSRWRITEDQSNTPNNWTTISSSVPSGTPVNGTGSLWVRTA